MFYRAVLSKNNKKFTNTSGLSVLQSQKKTKLCPDCKQVWICQGSKWCHPCYIHNHHPRKGKHCSKETKDKISIANKGKRPAIYIDGRCSKKYFCKECDNSICIATALYGSGLCRYCGDKRFHKYKNIWMRSSWEVKYAKYLDKQDIKWLYESKPFDLGSTTYTPDFYLPAKDLYIEIKGWWRDTAKKKFVLFQQLFPKVTLKVLHQKDLEQMGVL